MSGIQVSGLLSNSAFDWKSIVDQLIAVESTPITKLTKEQTTNTEQATALAAIKTSMVELQDSVQAIRAGNIFSSRSVQSDVVGTTWKSNSAIGATLGNYKIQVQTLATQAQTNGATDIGGKLNATNDVSGLTLANLSTGTAVTAGTFTVNGQPVTVALTDSLQGVFDKIAAATSGTVTAAYSATTDKVTFTSTSGELVLGAGNDSSNFLAAMKLANNGTTSATSSGALGAVKASSPLASAGLRTPITAVDASGNGSFSVNGVTISYNVNTDSLNTIIGRINQSTAGVNARYDSVSDQMIVVNEATGDIGMGLNESGAGLLAAIGLTGASGATLVHGENATFTINDGPVRTSMTNTLESSITGITGLSVTVNTESTQTLTVESDTAAMQTAIQSVLDKFNALQDLIETDTKVSTSGGTITTAVLSGNREVQQWGTQLRAMMFDAVSGLTGSVTRFDNLGIDFDSTTGHLTIKNQDKLTAALTDEPVDVEAFFLTADTGLVGKMYGLLTKLSSADDLEQKQLTETNHDIDTQIETLQRRVDNERTKLTEAFMAMLDAQQKAQSQNTYLTNTYFKSSSSNG